MDESSEIRKNTFAGVGGPEMQKQKNNSQAAPRDPQGPETPKKILKRISGHGRGPTFLGFFGVSGP